MALMRLLGRCAINRLFHFLPSVGELVAECSPHLENAVREPELEDPASNRCIGALIAKVDMLPCLRPPLSIFHHLQRLWIFCRILHRSLRADHPNKPGVRFARSNSFRMKGYRKLVILQIDLAKYRCIVPRPAGNQVSVRVRSFPDNLAELGLHPRRKPAESKGDMEGMHPQITHTA